MQPHVHRDNMLLLWALEGRMSTNPTIAVFEPCCRTRRRALIDQMMSGRLDEGEDQVRRGISRQAMVQGKVSGKAGDRSLVTTPVPARLLKPRSRLEMWRSEQTHEVEMVSDPSSTLG